MRWAALLVAFAALLLVRGDSPARGAEPSDQVRDLLGAIDFVPQRSHLDEVMGPLPLQELIAIATDIQTDPGVRLQAVRALAQYPDPQSVDTLEQTIDTFDNQAFGTGLLILRAAAEALAEIGGADAVPVITPLLQNSSRDVRAAAAHALRVIGSPTAVPALRAQQQVETSDQVQFAITEALRALVGGS